MTLLAGPFVIAAALLLVAGTLKLSRPGDTSNALRSLGLPGHPLLVRTGAVAEILVGAGALAFGDRLFAVLVVISYFGFACFVVRALRRQVPISTCGCFGRADTPPSAGHVVVSVAAALSAGAVALDPAAGIPDVLGSQPLGGVPFLLLAAIGVYLSFLVLTLLPRTLAAARP